MPSWRAHPNHLNEFLDSTDYGHDKRNCKRSMTRSLHMQTCLSESPTREPFFPRYHRSVCHEDRKKCLAERKDREVDMYQTIMGSSKSYPNLLTMAPDSPKESRNVTADNGDFPCPYARTTAAKSSLVKMAYTKPLPMSTSLDRSPSNASRGKLYNTISSWREAFPPGAPLDDSATPMVPGAANLNAGDLSSFYTTLRSTADTRSHSVPFPQSLQTWPPLRV